MVAYIETDGKSMLPFKGKKNIYKYIIPSDPLELVPGVKKLEEDDQIEYIIIDGKSTDGTIEIIKSYGDKIAKFISEKDDGIYDAMNKGIALATGDIIGILNSDDIYTDENVISRVVLKSSAAGAVETSSEKEEAVREKQLENA